MTNELEVGLDAGHGLRPLTGVNSKQTPDGMKEWTFNNAVTNEMAKLLAGYEGVKTFFTHDTTGKVDVPLSTRTGKVKNKKADVLVSVHANAYGSTWNDAHGLETFIYNEVCKGADKLAKNVQTALVKETGLADRGVKKANLHMVREARKVATSILVECGFMTNRKEAALLKSDDYRKKCAKAIVAGIVKTYGLKKKAAPKPVSTAAAKPKYELPTGTLRNGDEGNGVKALQTALTAAKFSTKGVDGKFGDNTGKALKGFQAKYKLVADGIYGAASRKKLNEVIN